MRTAARMKGIAPFYVMELLARAKELEAEGRSIIHMEVGEPGFELPEEVKQAGRDALDAGRTHYTAATGIPELRTAVARYYADYGVTVDPSRVVITPGSSGALQLVMGVLFNNGEEVIMTDPCYPCNKHFVLTFGAVPKLLPVDAGSNFQLTAEKVAEAWGPQTRGVIVASPSNPTGTLLEEPELEKIFQVVEKNDGVLIVDEIYHKLVFGRPSCTALALSDRIIVLNSFSKYHGMTGLRVGWMVVPEDLIAPLTRLTQNLFISPPSLSQYMALRSLESDCTAIFEERRRTFEKRRDLLLAGLRKLGFIIPAVPEGAFYIYADCSAFSADSMSFCYALLENAGVAITPGKDFGTHEAASHIRFACTGSSAEIEEALRRLHTFLQN